MDSWDQKNQEDLQKEYQEDLCNFMMKLKRHQANNHKPEEPIVYDVQNHPLVYHVNGEPIAPEQSTIYDSIPRNSVKFKALKDGYAFAIESYNKWLENDNHYVQPLMFETKIRCV